jgi:hypothetical protein
MVWLLPLIIIGGFFYPLLGYLVLAMMASFLTLSFFKGRYWCWNLCPRGAFLDIIMLKLSPNKPVPRIFTKQWFRWLILAVVISLFLWRILKAGGNLIAIGIVFVTMCLITTLIAIILAIITKHRGWCVICPMGTLQEKIGQIKRQSRVSSHPDRTRGAVPIIEYIVLIIVVIAALLSTSEYIRRAICGRWRELIDNTFGPRQYEPGKTIIERIR